jgi:hypothetical protein
VSIRPSPYPSITAGRGFFYYIDIVIYCPNEIHKRPTYRTGPDRKAVEYPPQSRILFVSDESSVGRFKVQCGSHRCRKENGEPGVNGKGLPITRAHWFEIVLNGCGGYQVNELPVEKFQLNPVPVVVSECQS